MFKAFISSSGKYLREIVCVFMSCQDQKTIIQVLLYVVGCSIYNIFFYIIFYRFSYNVTKLNACEKMHRKINFTSNNWLLKRVDWWTGNHFHLHATDGKLRRKKCRCIEFMCEWCDYVPYQKINPNAYICWRIRAYYMVKMAKQSAWFSARKW